jgi:phosphonate transport system substrate-binding protein
MTTRRLSAPAALTRRSLLASAAAFAAVVMLPRRVRAAAPLRVGMVPDAGATQVSIDQKKPLRDYLAAKLGRDVELVIPTNYNATVEALGNGSLDFAYLGGLTYAKAHAQYGVVPLVQRTSDRQFHSLFITQTGSAINALKDLRGKKFAFGDINSTSGHLMPFYALTQAGLDPDKDLSYRYTGNHPATAKAVEAGVVDAGAMDESVYHTMIDGNQLEKTKVRVFFTTPPFLDYVWVARKETTPAERAAFANAFLGLRAPADAAVLEILRGTSFVRANDAEYNLLRTIATKLKLL